MGLECELGQQASAVLRYFYGIIKWTKWDLIKLERKTRSILKQYQSHHINASVDRLYLPRVEGGRGQTNVEMAWERECLSTAIYLNRTADRQVLGVMQLHRDLMKMGVASHLDDPQYVSDKYNIEIDFSQPWDEGGPAGALIKRRLRESQLDKFRVRLRDKLIHGVLAKQLDDPETDQKVTHRGLKDGKLQAETEAEIIAAQDRVTHTAAYVT